MSREGRTPEETVFMDELVDNCSCIIDTSTIHGGRMSASARARVVPNNPITFPPSMEVTHKSSHLRLKPVSFALLLLIPSLVSAESLREFQERQCKQDKQVSCERAADMLEGEQHAERIVVLGVKFATNVDRVTREADKKPILGEAYSDVLDDYFKAEAENGVKLAVTADVINLCAEHYHDYWINRKMWWPTNDTGQPDWSTIYYYIVDHYYGYCLRQFH